MMTRPASDYWDDLLSTSWEVRPQVIEAPQHRLLLSEEELFDCVVRAARASTPLRRLYLDGTVVHDSECEPLLPAATDRSLKGYYRRVEAQTGGAEWSLCLSRIHSVSHLLWERAAAFLDPLIARRGPHLLGSADTDAFLGWYRSTPVGIHCDHAANFMFTYGGTKTMLVWPPEREAELPLCQQDWSAARPTATPLTGAPTNMVYIPSAWFHLAEASAGPVASVNVALFFDSSPIDVAITELRQHLGRGGVIDRASSYGEALDLLVSAGADPAIRDRLTAATLRHRTARGFGHLLPPAEAEDIEAGTQFVRANFAIESVIASDPSATIVAANGHSGRLRTSAAVDRLIDDLNSGRETSAASAARGHDDDEELVGMLLVRLRQWRAVEPAA